MNFEKIIDNIRTQINNLNDKDHLQELQQPKDIKSLSDYYQNNKLKSFEYNMKKKNRKSTDQNTTKKKEFIVLEQDKTMEMIDQEIQSLKYNDWDKLLLNIQNERLNTYVDTFSNMASSTKKKLKRELKTMLYNRKLTSKKINYDREEGVIQKIEDLTINHINDTFTFNDT